MRRLEGPRVIVTPDLRLLLAQELDSILTKNGLVKLNLRLVGTTCLVVDAATPTRVMVSACAMFLESHSQVDLVLVPDQRLRTWFGTNSRPIIGLAGLYQVGYTFSDPDFIDHLISDLTSLLEIAQDSEWL